MKQLQAAYPKEILVAEDVRAGNTRNSYASLHAFVPPPPPPPSAPSSTEEINPPVISNLTVNAATSSVTINWTTNKLGTSQLLFGVSTAMSAHVPSDPNFTTSHSIRIFELVPGTTYYYEAQSTDPSGKVGSRRSNRLRRQQQTHRQALHQKCSRRDFHRLRSASMIDFAN